MRRVPALLSVLLAIAGCSRPARSPREPKPEEPHLTVVTWNVNYGLAGDAAMVGALGRLDADVVFLQETNAAWEEAIRRDLADEWPHMAFRHVGGAGGMAVLSKTPFEDVEELPAESWFPAWVVRVESAVGPVQVLNVHLRPNFSDSGSITSGYFTTPKVRKREMSVFADALDDAVPTLVVGDFNEDEDGKGMAVLKEKGFRSALPEFDPKAKTWAWPTSVGHVRARLDHVVYDERLEPLNVEVLPEGRSDHFPVRATFTAAP